MEPSADPVFEALGFFLETFLIRCISLLLNSTGGAAKAVSAVYATDANAAADANAIAEPNSAAGDVCCAAACAAANPAHSRDWLAGRVEMFHGGFHKPRMILVGCILQESGGH
eukprot:g31754.t1